jgi:adenylosuccinate synthase
MGRRCVKVIAGLGFGDEGKGTTIDYMTRVYGAKLVVRYNGGAQAGHNVVMPTDGTGDTARHHVFSQFGSGTFWGARTHLSRFVLVNPISMLSEAKHLEAIGLPGALENLVTIEEDAVITTPFHVATNRIRELLRENRHGSCGMGIGETMQDFLNIEKRTEMEMVIFAKDLSDEKTLRKKLLAQQELKIEELCRDGLVPCVTGNSRLKEEWDVLVNGNTITQTIEYFSKEFVRRAKIVGQEWLGKELEKPQITLFEGAQGVLLDQDWGFQPHTTYTKTTFANAQELLSSCGGWELLDDIIYVGIMRPYMTRHGAGPLVTEDKALKALAAGDHNCWNEWQHGFRIGALDLVLLKYAITVLEVDPDELVITNLDKLDSIRNEIPICKKYEDKDTDLSPWGMDLNKFRKEKQRQLEKALLSARPIIQKSKMDPDDVNGISFAHSIAEKLEVPLTLVSRGPTWLDKIQIPHAPRDDD